MLQGGLAGRKSKGKLGRQHSDIHLSALHHMSFGLVPRLTHMRSKWACKWGRRSKAEIGYARFYSDAMDLWQFVCVCVVSTLHVGVRHVYS